jgi:nitrate reductase assembly molybdenum cofactor insertion protein NarJ
MIVRTLEDKQLALALIGRLLEYPTENYFELMKTATRFLKDHFPQQAKPMHEFEKLVSLKELWELEEVFTRTFDLAPICCPYISAHLYGDESYDRGGFMAHLNLRYEERGFDLKGEMPDHLGAILRFAPNFGAEEFNELIHFCLSVPVKEMTAGLESSENCYFFLLQTINQLLAVDLPGVIAS